MQDASGSNSDLQAEEAELSEDEPQLDDWATDSAVGGVRSTAYGLSNDNHHGRN
jgi:hypothetical protein